MKVLRSTYKHQRVQEGFWKKGTYTFQAVVKSSSGYSFAFYGSDWIVFNVSWKVDPNEYSRVVHTFTLEEDCTRFSIVANDGEVFVYQPMLEQGSNASTPIANEEDLKGMDGDNHEFIFTRNNTGEKPDTPLSIQEDDHEPEGWTDNAQGVSPDHLFEFVSMRERKNGVWLDYSPPSLWAKWAEDGLSVNLNVQGHYNSHWEGTTKVVEIVGGVDVGGNEVVKVSAVFRKGENNIAATVSQSRGFQWYVNGVHLASFDNQPFITLDETYGDGFADYVVLSYLVNSIREEERREIINISEGMDGIGEEFIFKANNSDTEPPVLPQTTDVGYQNDDYHGNWSDDPVAPTELNQFVWTAKRKKVGGIWEAFGTPSIWTKWVEDGASIATVTDYYAVSTSGTIPPATWQTTMPTKSANEYLWNYEVITYTDGRTPTETQKRVIQGNDARSIHDIKNAYAYSSSDTTPPIAGWQYSIAALGTKPAGYFLWVRDDIAYTDNPSNYIGTTGYVVRDGADGKDGEGILSVIDYYGLSTSESVLPSTWYTTVPAKAANEFLWNYERIIYTDTTYDETQARIIQGKDAVGIESIVNAYGYSTNYTDPPSLWYYLADLPAKQEGDVLWVREDITYTNGTSNSTQGYPVRDGADGDKGDTGKGVTSLEKMYRVHTSDTSVPYPPIGWSVTPPSYEQGKHLWTCEEVKWTDGTTTYTTPQVERSWAAMLEFEYLKSAIQQDAQIQGALYTMVTLLLKEDMGAGVTAGISGIQGTGKNSPAIWAGGNYAQAQKFVSFIEKIANGQATTLKEYNDLPKIVFLHNGAGKMGDFMIDKAGRIVMIDPITGNIRLMFRTSNIPTAQELNDALSPGETITIGSGSTSSYVNLSGSTNVTRAGSTAIYEGATVTISGTGRGVESPGGMQILSAITATLWLCRNGVPIQALESASLDFNSTSYVSDSRTRTLPSVSTTINQTGTYTVRLIITTEGDVLESNASVTTSTFSWQFQTANVRRFEFGVDGFMAWFTNNAVHFDEQNGFFIKGKTNMPGVLLSASVQQNGGFLSQWGAKKHNTNTATRNSVGRYTVYHSVGHTNYHVSASPTTGNRTHYIVSKGTTSFVIQWYSVGSSPTASDTAFDFTITGNNY